MDIFNTATETVTRQVRKDNIPIVYELIKKGFQNPYKMFRENTILDIYTSKEVIKDFKRIKDEFITKSKGMFLLIPEVKTMEVIDGLETMVVSQDAVYFDPIRLDTTYNSIDKVYLDVPTVCRDIVANYPTEKVSRTFSEFKEELTAV